MKYDCIIIGAGLGGLSAGAKLAKEGKKVMVLEQHDRPGGCATTFKRKEFILEVGLHEMDGPHAKDLKVKIFRDLELADKVVLLPLPEFYRFVNERYNVVMPHDPLQAERMLTELFPDDAQGIQTYFYYLLNSRKILADAAGSPERTLGEFLDEHIVNEDLKLILLGNLGYFHDDPYSISLNYYLVAQGSYFGGSASFIKGGSQQLSNALVEVIEAHGGIVKLNTICTRILFEGNKAVGVAYENIASKIKEGFADMANEIIVNASVPSLAGSLLPEPQALALGSKISNIAVGASLLTVYFGFKKSLKDLGNTYYSTFVFDSSIRTQKDIKANNRSDFNTRGFTLVDYSQVDSALAPEGKSVGAVCCIDYASDWEGLEQSQYLEKKAKVAEAIMGRCEKLIPGFRKAVEYVEVGTPLTVRRYTLNPEGAVYGFAQNPGKSMEYLNDLPENLSIASAWGKFGGGFSGAIYSGYMTAMEILRKR